MRYSALMGHTNCMPQIAGDSVLTKPRGWYSTASPSNAPRRNSKVVAIVPSASRRYVSTALCASRSMKVGMLAMTYQRPMKRSRSTSSTVAIAGGCEQAWASNAATGAHSRLRPNRDLRE